MSRFDEAMDGLGTVEEDQIEDLNVSGRGER